jgi:hypothetical protein
MPPGYPVVHNFLPDLEGFYEAWLGRKLPLASLTPPRALRAAVCRSFRENPQIRCGDVR